MTTANTAKIHTSIESASAVLPVGMVQAACKWKETEKQTAKQRAVHIPMECVKAPEVPESFRALVESVLTTAAESALKSFVNDNPNSFEIGLEVFARPSLTESFLARADNWMTKEELEVGFTKSATWKRIAGRAEFEKNAVYRKAAEHFRDSILKLTGKAVQMEADKCDLILAKLEDADLETEFGAFVVKRLNALREKGKAEFDLSAL